jgi:hypothetical protein
LEEVKRLVLTIALCVGCWLAADAQSTFTEQLQQSKSGEGKVTVTHDKAIDELVNSAAATQATVPSTKIPQSNKPADDRTSQDKKDIRKDLDDTTDAIAVPDTVDLRKKIMKGGTKINGFRVQVFAGGNGRADRQKAQRTGDEIKSLFPNEPVYVHFYSPRWICRMGNYRTYEEAHDVLRQVKQLGYSSAVIVKGKITVYYP